MGWGVVFCENFYFYCSQKEKNFVSIKCAEWKSIKKKTTKLRTMKKEILRKTIRAEFNVLNWFKLVFICRAIKHKPVVSDILKVYQSERLCLRPIVNFMCCVVFDWKKKYSVDRPDRMLFFFLLLLFWIDENVFKRKENRFFHRNKEDESALTFGRMPESVLCFINSTQNQFFSQHIRRYKEHQIYDNWKSVGELFSNIINQWIHLTI